MLTFDEMWKSLPWNEQREIELVFVEELNAMARQEAIMPSSYPFPHLLAKQNFYERVYESFSRRHRGEL